MGNCRINILGKNSFLGGPPCHLLSLDLITALHSKGIFNLHQASRGRFEDMLSGNWKTVADLDLQGSLAFEWNAFIKVLISNGIFLFDVGDSIVWRANRSSNHPSAKLAYDYIFSRTPSPIQIGGTQNFGTGQFPSSSSVLFGFPGEQSSHLGQSLTQRFLWAQHMLPLFPWL